MPKRVGPAVGQGQAFVRKSRNFTQKHQKVHSKIAPRPNAGCGAGRRKHVANRPRIGGSRSGEAYAVLRATIRVVHAIDARISFAAPSRCFDNRIADPRAFRSSQEHRLRGRQEHNHVAMFDAIRRLAEWRPRSRARYCSSSRATGFGTRNSVPSSLAP
jgi:hypothetical protein